MSERDTPQQPDPYDLDEPGDDEQAPQPAFDVEAGPAALSSMDHRPDAGLVPADVVLDAQGRIGEDISCRVCAYNLRGVDPVATCPECGTAVGRSLVGDRLKFADPQWVRKLSAGFLWLIVSVFVGIAFGCVERQATSIATDTVSGAVVGLLGLIAPFIALVGYWQITTPEPVEKFGDPDTTRILARWCNVSPPVLSALALPLVLADTQVMFIAAAVVEVIGGLVGLVGAFAAFTYVRRLALRIPDDALAKQTRIVMWGYAAALLFLVLVGLGALVIYWGGNDDMFAIIAAPACIAGLLFLTFGIWAIVLMFLYRSRLEVAAREASGTWARRGGG